MFSCQASPGNQKNLFQKVVHLFLRWFGLTEYVSSCKLTSGPKPERTRQQINEVNPRELLNSMHVWLKESKWTAAAQTPTCEPVSYDPRLSTGRHTAACAGGRSPSCGKSVRRDLSPGRTRRRSWCSSWWRCSKPTCQKTSKVGGGEERCCMTEWSSNAMNAVCVTITSLPSCFLMYIFFISLFLYLIIWALQHSMENCKPSLLN